MSATELKQLYPSLKILENIPLANYTYTETGGPADVLIFPKNTVEVKDVADYAKEKNIPLTVLGNASNLVVRDGGIRGIVMILTDMKKISVDGDFVTAESGAAFIEMTHKAYEASLTGLEFACGIPGSVGGAVYMNAGAYGGELKDVFDHAEVLTRDGVFKTLTAADMDFSYRHSAIQENHDIVLSATTKLTKGNQAEIKAIMDDLTEKRTSKQPLEYPSCGSVFKRPEGHFTGKLIQDAGLQGLKWGGAQISEKHAGFIINYNHEATATDYIELIQYIQKTIWEKFQVKLETEVRIIGEE